MEAKDLRIGNWVNLYDDFNTQVTGLTNTGKVWCVDNPQDENCAWSPDKIKPIPLTEEWLLKFGFAEGEYGYWIEMKDKTLWVKLNGVVLIADGFGFVGITDIKIDKVHLIQNLWHSLTGKELIKN